MGIGKYFVTSSGNANKPKIKQNFWEISLNQCQCSGSGQIPNQDDLNESSQFLSLYKFMQTQGKNQLIIYNIETKQKEVKILDSKLKIDYTTSITQLPNGELFCYCSRNSGITMIIDKNYRVQMLPSGTLCGWSSALYFDNNIYCFGGGNIGEIALSMKFDLKNNRWIHLTSLQEGDFFCHSVIFNRNILISGYYCQNLLLYEIEIDSFSKIPYIFSGHKKKFMANVKNLYLIEWDEEDGLIYESEDEYQWKPISKSGILDYGYQMYCLYNKEKIYISTWNNYYQFDLKNKVVLLIR